MPLLHRVFRYLMLVGLIAVPHYIMVGKWGDLTLRDGLVVLAFGALAYYLVDWHWGEKWRN